MGKNWNEEASRAFALATYLPYVFIFFNRNGLQPPETNNGDPSLSLHGGPGPPSSLTNSLDPGSADVGRGGESGGRGGESSAETVETEEAPAAAELQSGVSRPSASQPSAHSRARPQFLLSARPTGPLRSASWLLA